MVKREISNKIKELSLKYPVIALTGPRQSGKSTLVKSLYPHYQYINLENPTLRSFAENDPEAFLKKYNTNIIFDEIQYVPLLLSYIQTIVDERKKNGDFIITGSSQFKLLEAITQSLAGRVSIFQLLPLSFNELKSENLINKDYIEMAVKGFYPAIYDRNILPEDYYADYLQTYVERDVRSLINVKDLKTFQLFIKMCAGRVGSVINYTSIGNDLGMSRETVKNWINVLESSYIAFQLPPYFINLNKRLVKSPKLYFYDTGLLCYLLGVSEKSLLTHPNRGGVFENLIINELQKRKLNQHLIPDFYFYSEHSGTEVDLVMPNEGKLIGIELKSASTYHLSFNKNLKSFKKVMEDKVDSLYVVYAGDSQNRNGIPVICWHDLDEISL